MIARIAPALLAVPLLASIVVSTSGCVGIAAGGAAAGASVAIDRRTTGTVIEDQAIELKAASALYQDKELHEQAHINTTSFNTQLLVTGEAPTAAMRDRIIDIMRNIPKVSRVYNEIAIAAPSSTVARSNDSLLTTKVKSKLLISEQIRGNHIKVVTERGTVYLMGLVTRAEGDTAASLARVIGGVQKVVKVFEYTN